jgi:hypothetical protein
MTMLNRMLRVRLDRTTMTVVLAAVLAAGCSEEVAGGGGGGGTDAAADSGGASDSSATGDASSDTVSVEDGSAGSDSATAEDGQADGGSTGSDGGPDDASSGDATVSDSTAADTGGGGSDGGGSSGGDTSGSDGGSSDGGSSGGGSGEFQGLLIKILGPSGRDWVQNTGQQIQLSGVAFGNPTSIDWADQSGKTGKITPAAAWKSGILTLQEGDNHFTVTATKDGKSVSDTIHIVYNPVFQFEGPPDITPNVLFVNENSKLVVRFVATGAVAGADGKSIVDPSTIQLVEVDDNGVEVGGGVSTQLKDSGSGGNCDDVAKDAVFSACLNISANVAKTKYFRVKANVDLGVKKYTAKSPLAVVDVVARFDKGVCNSIVGLQKKLKSDYVAAVKGGTSAKAAQQAVIDVLKADANVAEAGPAEAAGYGVWVRYKSGQVGALNLSPEGTRGWSSPVDAGAALPTYSVGTRRALTLAPFQSEFSQAGGDEADLAGTALKAKQCPPFAVDQATGSQAYLRWYREMSQYGLVAITGHGEALFGGMDPQTYKDLGWEHQGAQEVIWSGEPVNCNALSSSNATCNQQGGGCPTGETCIKTSISGGVCVDNTQADIMRGRVAIGDETYAMLPGLLRHHLVNNFASSIVYLGACRSMYNGSLAMQLRAAGAATVVGFSDYVSSTYAADSGKSFFDALGQGKSTVQALPTKDADPKYGGKLRTFGIGESNLNNSALINPSWDSGNLTGWKPVGDGRVISRLGVTIPVAGKYMGIISTGLGFTAQNGSLAQPFCPAKGQTELCFFWKFYSEEFTEYCGSQFMDTFMATIKSDVSNYTPVNVYIDSLCPYDCGGKSPCEPGSPSCKCGSTWKTLSQADVAFDQGGVWMTPWVKSCQDISAIAVNGDKKVELTFFATDKGDSIFDTAILVDEVTVK